MSDLEKFNLFLETIDLETYREKFTHIKTVELDLPKEIQALPALYDNYWLNRNDWLLYDDFYEVYYNEISDLIESFRIKSHFSEHTFSLGLKARIYRTWASLITQIQGGYVCEEIYGEHNVVMNAELDWQGIDFRIQKGNKFANIQIKKDTFNIGGLHGLTMSARYEVIKSRTKNNLTQINYELAPKKYTEVKQNIRDSYLKWEAKYKNQLRLLDNGFVIFETGMFDASKINFE